MDSQSIEDAREEEAAHKIRQLLQALSPEERQRAIALLERYVKLYSEPAFKHFYGVKREKR